MSFRSSHGLSLLMLLLMGCGGESKPSTVPVTGLVTLNGEPVAEASVTFYPQEGRSASGVTDSSGIFTLTTFEAGDGAIAGKHRVSIGKQSNVPAGNTPEELAKIKEEIPSKYNNAETSGLTADVVAGQDAPIDFNLAE